MSVRRTAGSSLVTAEEWFAGGQRIPYDPGSACVVTEEEAAASPGGLRVFERVATAEQGVDEDVVWLTLLPGFPDGSYGWARVDRLLGAGVGPRLYVEPVGQGDSDKPRGYRYSTVERADLVEALWRHHGVHYTVVVAFDYTAMALLELLRRQLERSTATPGITAAFMVNGGVFADAHTHPWWTTPVLQTPLGAPWMRAAQRSPRVFDATLLRARLYSRGSNSLATCQMFTGRRGRTLQECRSSTTSWFGGSMPRQAVTPVGSRQRPSRSRTFGGPTCSTRAGSRSTSCTPSTNRRSERSGSNSPQSQRPSTKVAADPSESLEQRLRSSLSRLPRRLRRTPRWTAPACSVPTR